MWLYLIIFLIPVLAYYKGGAINRNKRFLSLYLLFLALFVGLSDMFGGYDRYIYGSVFDTIADGITCGDSARVAYGMSYFEIGYSALSYVIALITENRYIYIFIITLIIYYCIYKSFEVNMSNYPFAIILFLGMVFFFSFTYLRQVLAFSVAWWGIRFLIEKKTFKFFAVVLAVSLLHKSGIVFVALYFLPLKKWSIKEVLTILSLCGLIGLSGITGTLYDTYIDASGISNSNTYSSDGSVRIAYLLEVVFFIWIILKSYNRIEPNRRNLIFLNMAWVFCGLLLLFIRSSDGGRVAWFFTIGVIYIITLICTTNDLLARVKSMIGPILIIVMLALYVRVYDSWQLYNNLYPYKTFLTDGYRSPDYSWSRYEYDHNYDVDKFYRPAFRFLK